MDSLEFSHKCMHVSQEVQNSNNLVEAIEQPAKSYEFLSVELSGAWEPGDRERA